MTRKSSLRMSIVAIVATLALSLTAAPAFAQGPGSGGGKGGPPSGRGETTLGNNLSVPAIFVPSITGAPTLRLPCPSAAVPPGWDGTPTSTLYPGYWLQKTVATWTAQCATKATDSVTAQWGANLTDAPANTLVAGKPIRVEVNLLDTAAIGMTGYAITNLTPSAPDREAVYGADGTTFTTVADPLSGQVTRVWTPEASLTIKNVDTGATTTVAIPAEINSTGAVVFGYNWGSKGKKPVAGSYELTFTIPVATPESGVTITDVVAGESRHPTFTASTTTIAFTLLPSHSGGGPR